jgi:alpha-beta hydrolase superfamily lysophospholipase
MDDVYSITARENWLAGAGGRIFARHWPATGTPMAALVICHGFNAHSGHYARAAEAFARRGIAVTALDLRGRGRSEGEPFYVETIDDYADDLARAIEFAREQTPDLPIYLLGHSAGGVTAITYAVRHQDQLAGLICESFAYRVFAPDLALQLLRGISHLLPHAQVLRLKNQDFSRDPAWIEALGADPLVRDEAEPVQTMVALARADERLSDAFGKVRLPLLVLHGTADRAARAEGSQAFFDAAASEDKTLKLYEGHYHDLLNDLDRDRVMNDIGNWIERRAGKQ